MRAISKAILSLAVCTMCAAPAAAQDSGTLKKIKDSGALTLGVGEINRIYARWFQSPIPPRNVNLNVPMSDTLKDYIRNPNDKGVDKCGRMKCMMWLPQGV